MNYMSAHLLNFFHTKPALSRHKPQIIQGQYKLYMPACYVFCMLPFVRTMLPFMCAMLPFIYSDSEVHL